MKKFLIGLVVALLTQIAYGQIVQDFNVGPTAAKRFAVITTGTSATNATYPGITFVTKDSTVVSDLSYTYTPPDGQALKLYPDSLYLLWGGKGYTTADSIGLVGVLGPVFDGSAAALTIPITRTTFDSIKVAEHDTKLLTRSWYQPFNRLKVVWQLNSYVGPTTADKTEHVSLGGAYFYATLRAFYHIPN